MTQPRYAEFIRLKTIVNRFIAWRDQDGNIQGTDHDGGTANG